MLSLFPAQEITGQEDTELCCLGGAVMWVKSNFSSYPLQCVQTCVFLSFFCSFLFLLQWCAGASLLEFWTFTKTLSSTSDCLKTVFSRDYWTVAKMDWRQFTGHCRVPAGTMMPITWCMREKVSFQVLWSMMLDPLPPSKAFLPVNGCWILVVKGRYHDGCIFQACC